MTEDEIKTVKKEFRAYLRKTCGKHGTVLSSLMSAAETHLPRLVKERWLPSFTFLYDMDNDMRLLMRVLLQMEKDDGLLAEQGGYISPQCLDFYIKFLCLRNHLQFDELKREVEASTTEEEAEEELSEGNASTSAVTRYERNPKARKACLDHYGCRCYVCGIDMAETYGKELGERAIEVHHIIPVSQRGGSYIIDPIRDLRPLCPNCHSIVHRKRGAPMDVELLKAQYQERHP